MKGGAADPQTLKNLLLIKQQANMTPLDFFTMHKTTSGTSH